MISRRSVTLRHIGLWIGIFFALYPVVWIISASVNPVDNLAASRLIPEGLTLDNYRGLFDDPLVPFRDWLINSWKISLAGAIGNLALAALAAYSFSRLRFRGRRAGLLGLLLVQVFPQFLGFIAIFFTLQAIGEVAPGFGLDTHAGLLLVYLGGAIGFNTYLIKGFMDTVPISLDEAAKVDGASPALIFWRVILPLTRPVLGVIFIITFVGLYGELLLASVLLRSAENFTLAMGLQQFSLSEYAAKWGALSAAAILGSAPIVATFLVAQKQIVGGLTQGGVKG
ncbi:MAG: sugar ABC transporter permease [Acidimicrobiia bacterium]|nr:MAG: sugar ABC transporter permease [Acidimicrobiia bacterium]